MSVGSSGRLTSAERRRRILDVARVEFVGMGYEGARIQRIASAAGVTDALLYKHFASKRELFEEAVVDPLQRVMGDQLLAIVSLPVGSDGTPQRTAAYQLTRNLIEALAETIELLGVVLFGEHESGSRFYIDHVRPAIDQAIAGVVKNLPRWPHRDFDPEIATEAYFGMAFGLVLDRSMRGVPLDVDKCAREITALLFDGTAEH